MIKVWGRLSSSNVQIVLWCLEELELPYERTDAGYLYGVVNTPEYRALNPNGTVPTVRDGDNPVIWESAAILRYLCHCYAKPPFWPEDIVDRTRVDQWAEWGKVNLSGLFTHPVFWRVVRTAPSKRDEAAIQRAVDALEEKLLIAEERLHVHPWLTGSDFTLADLQLGQVLHRYFDIDIKRREFSALQTYYEKLQEREAYSSTVMASYDELRIFD